jgi:hypothetical protein
MIAVILFVLGIQASPFKAKSRLEAENASAIEIASLAPSSHVDCAPWA